MEVREPFPNSIPDGWSKYTLDEYLKEPIRNGFSPVCPEQSTGDWVLSLASVGFDGYSPLGAKPAPLGDPRVEASRLVAGDIVVSRSNTPDRVGLAGIYNGDPTPASYPDLLMRVRVKPSIDNRFLLEQMLSQSGRNYFSSTARGSSGSMVKIDRTILEAFPVLAPCDIQEQRAIATALTDADALIDSLEQLLTKKRELPPEFRLPRIDG
jgi:type I restriction enzyme S subunit